MQALNFQIHYVEGRPTRITFCPLPACSSVSRYPILRDVVMKYIGVDGWHTNGDNNLEYSIPLVSQLDFDEQIATIIVSLCQTAVSEAMDALMKFGDMHMAWEAYLKAKGAG